MRVKVGNDIQHYGSRSYLDAVDDIIGLPMHELMRITRATERSAAWLEDDLPEERPPDFLYRVYGLASQI